MNLEHHLILPKLVLAFLLLGALRRRPVQRNTVEPCLHLRQHRMGQRQPQIACPVKLAEGLYYHIHFYLRSVESPLIVLIRRRKIKWSASTLLMMHIRHQSISMFQMQQKFTQLTTSLEQWSRAPCVLIVCEVTPELLLS